MSKANYILFCLLFFFLQKSTSLIQHEIKESKDFSDKKIKFPRKKPYKEKPFPFNNNHTDEFDSIKKLERLEKLKRESHKLRRQNSRLVMIIILLVGIILIIISLNLFVKYYNHYLSKKQKKFYEELKLKNNKVSKKEEEKNESLNEKMINNLEAPISVIDSIRSSKKTDFSVSDDEKNKGIIIIPNESDLQLYKPYDDIEDDDNNDIIQIDLNNVKN